MSEPLLIFQAKGDRKRSVDNTLLPEPQQNLPLAQKEPIGANRVESAYSLIDTKKPRLFELWMKMTPPIQDHWQDCSNLTQGQHDEILAKCAARMAQGVAVYGDKSYLTDGRNMYKEAEEEILDAIIYMQFEQEKNPEKKSFLEYMVIRLMQFLVDLENIKKT